MKFPVLYLAVFWMLCSIDGFAQSKVLERSVSFDFQNERLEDALSTISYAYGVNFSYSKDFIPINQRITATVDQWPLGEALDKLFFETQIVYKVIGNQIALKIDDDKAIGQVEPQEEAILTSVKVEEKDTIALVDTTNIQVEVDTTEYLEMEVEPGVGEDPDIADEVPNQDDKTVVDWNQWFDKFKRKNERSPDERYAQVSIVPNIGTNTTQSPEITNNVSLNLLWGDNGGVKGFEAGTFLNTVRKDVQGFQFAGLGNNVGNNVTGTQIGGLYNHNAGKTTGFQMAGLFNYSERADAGQFAGLSNIVENDFDGMQLSGIFNKAGYNSRGIQAAGLVNVTQGVANFQLGGLVNKARRVEGGQVGGFMNIAEDVKGFQLAFINVSDTVSGVPIGLINIVKRGYNRFELYGGEVLYFNIQAKLGAAQFYNIFHVGTRVPAIGNYVWGLGYGVGFRIKRTPHRFMNYEAMAIQINENEPWTNKLNMIGRFRILAGYKLGDLKTEFFFGPTINIMISQLRQPETDTVGSDIVPYSFFDKTVGTTKRTNYKGWIGLNVGLRF